MTVVMLGHPCLFCTSSLVYLSLTDLYTPNSLPITNKISSIWASFLIKLHTQSSIFIGPLPSFALFICRLSMSSHRWWDSCIIRTFPDILFFPFISTYVHYRTPVPYRSTAKVFVSIDETMFLTISFESTHFLIQRYYFCLSLHTASSITEYL